MMNSKSVILECLPIGVFMLSNEGVVTEWNKACELLTGVPASTMIGTADHWKPFYATKRPMLADLVQTQVSAEILAEHYENSITSSKHFAGGYGGEDYFPKLGHGKWLRFAANAIVDEEGKVVGSIETIQDVTDEREALEELKQSKERYKSLYLIDSKTHFQNAMGFELRLSGELEQLTPGNSLGVAVLEIQNLKSTNDLYGRPFGDHLIQIVARCIKLNIANSDSGFRCGGGRFYVLSTHNESGYLKKIAENVLALVEQYPILISTDNQLKCELHIACLEFHAGSTKLQVWKEIEHSVLNGDLG